MKKQLVIGIFLMLVLTGISLMPSSPASTYLITVNLIADHKTDIGDVKVSWSPDNISVQYILVEHWYLLETDVQVGKTLSDFHLNPKGSPCPGKFLHKSFFEATDVVQNYTEIFRRPTGLKGEINTSARAIVYNSETGEISTAWGDGTRFVPKGNFGTYFTYPLYLPLGYS
jgi:hypothetical protein